MRGPRRKPEPAPIHAPGAALRAEAARLVGKVLQEGGSLKSLLDTTLPQWSDHRDRALLEALCFEALRHARRYRFAADAWLQQPLPAEPLRPADRDLLALLLIGFAQLDAMRLADHAAVSATVDAARVLGLHSKAGLINALLRRAVREPLPESDDPAVRHSLPDWLDRRLARDWPEHAEAIRAATNRPAPLWLSAAEADVPMLLEQFKAADIDVEAMAFPPGALRLAGSGSITRLPGYAEGRWHVQDIAAQRCAFALDLRPGMRVLDACAAPGGKTVQILRALDGEGELWAMDLSAARVRRLQQNLERSAVDLGPLHLQAGDATDTAAWWDGRKFDRILLDAPCSATGVLRRQPDAKWNRRESDIDSLVALQARLLQALWPLLAEDGLLLYSTCSLLREENDAQVGRFLAAQADASLQALDHRYGNDTSSGSQSFPGEDGGDGFFYALLEKSL